MFYDLSREELVEKYPILNSGVGGDYILVYLSLEGVPTIQSHIALLQDNYELEDYIIGFCSSNENWERNVSLGQIMIRKADDVFDRNLLLVFVKESFYDNIDIKHIKNGLSRLVNVYKDYGIESITIDKDIFEEDIFTNFANDLNLPKINII